jgi:hypothetical protein
MQAMRCLKRLFPLLGWLAIGATVLYWLTHPETWDGTLEHDPRALGSVYALLAVLGLVAWARHQRQRRRQARPKQPRDEPASPEIPRHPEPR